MAKKKLTINQQQWKKEMKRIERFQKTASKRGFYFPDDLLPQQPKRITKKALQKLANITPEEQYSKAVYLDRETGKMVSGTEGRKIERSNASKKGWQARKYKATPRPKPKPDEPIIDSPDEPIIDNPDEPIIDSPDEPIIDIGSGEPLEVYSLIRAMDRVLDELSFKNGQVEEDVELETKMLKSTWNSTKERFKDHKHILEDYLRKNDYVMQTCLNVIYYESDSELVRHAMNTLIQILNYFIPLSTEKLKEFESEYTDIDLTDYDLPSIDE